MVGSLAAGMLGELDHAEQQAAAYAQFSSPGQYVGWAVTKVMAAVVATYRGRFAEATSPIEQALAALVGEDSLPWQLPAQLLLARAHAAQGHHEQADRALAEAGLPRRAMLVTVVIDEENAGHAVLMIRTDRGDFILDNKRNAILPWSQTGYVYVKRESQYRTGWTSLGGAQTPTVASVQR